MAKKKKKSHSLREGKVREDNASGGMALGMGETQSDTTGWDMERKQACTEHMRAWGGWTGQFWTWKKNPSKGGFKTGQKMNKI